MGVIKNVEDDNWTKDYTYYDNKGRVIGTYSVNHLGGYTKIESKLDFAGIVQNINTYHARLSNDSGVTVKERFVYDSQNRLKEHWHQVDSKPEQLLAQNTYNELSQLSNKKVGNNLQSIDYAYNIRGWMTDINKDQMGASDLGGKLFSYKIKYTQKDGITNPDTALFPGKDVKARYNGNIAEVDWRAVESLGANPSLTPKRYGYAYDALNRLTAGYYQNPNNAYSKEHTESLAYDLNGNITGLYRTTAIENNNTTATAIDNLEYTYTKGNQVSNIKDHMNNPSGYEGGNGTIEYDLNGNMWKIPDKNISAIRYNYLNLPSRIEYGDLGSLATNNYLFRGDGVKLQKIIPRFECGIINCYTVNSISDYLDGFQYFREQMENGGGTPGGPVESLRMHTEKLKHAQEQQAFTLERPEMELFPDSDGKVGGGNQTAKIFRAQGLIFFPTAEGFYDYTKDQYIYQYKDHLGNVRISFTRNSGGALEITDANDYYPFGMNHLKTGNSFYGEASYKNYKYNGKELQNSGMYDYGARFYMPDIGRWGVTDPLAEQYRRHSVYNYAVNNPIRFIDPDGRGVNDFVERKDGSIYWDNKANNQATTKEGETYLGKNLSFTFNSYIASNYDGPLGSLPEGDKLTTTINLSAQENEAGELTDLSATKTTKMGKTFGLFEGRDYYPGEGGSNNYFTQSGTTINYEQHASVPRFEESGLNSMGFKIVDVAQKLNINFDKKSGNLSVNAYTDVFPSATLKLNNTGTTLMNYKQPSAVGKKINP